ncbi:hypothetical protein VNI00_007767 [Paramarasmius palmivorus]|uniref:Uncharacterized protein n=1 Tax=Paramarasmius palmivorus TaxID=297713 RepID=A0AAW0CV78_9AGAR
MEFFNRVVDAYPRGPDGTLESVLRPRDATSLQVEMFLLRTLAELPVHFQRSFSTFPLLSSRFRSNIELVVSALGASVSDEGVRRIVTSLCRCPVAGVAAEKDLSSLPLGRLWADVVVRLEDLLHVQRAVRSDGNAAVYDACMVEWLRGGLRVFLGLEGVSDAELRRLAERVVPDVLGLLRG